MTENIQNMIEETKHMSDEMLKLADQSMEAVTGGQQSVSDLQAKPPGSGLRYQVDRERESGGGDYDTDLLNLKPDKPACLKRVDRKCKGW